MPVFMCVSDIHVFLFLTTSFQPLSFPQLAQQTCLQMQFVPQWFITPWITYINSIFVKKFTHSFIDSFIRYMNSPSL